VRDKLLRGLLKLVILAAVVAAVVVVLLKVSSKTHGLIVDTSVVVAAVFTVWLAVAPPAGRTTTGIAEQELEGAARDLARKVANGEMNQRTRLLNFVEEPAHIRLRAASYLHSFRQAAQPETCSWQGLFRAFWRSESRRLVLLGEPGAGKTLLLLEIVRQSREVLGDSRPVLIRVNASQWRTTATFNDFFVETVSRERGIAPDVVTRLLERRSIIPLLDGLDELDPEESGAPLRGLAIVARLNKAEYPADAPLIVTCRSSYFRLLEQKQLENEDEQIVGLAGAGALELEPLDADRISNYLEHNLRSEARARWRAVLGALDVSEPNVVSILALPWRLALAFSAYRNRGEPDVLISREGNTAVEAGLLPQFFTVAMRTQKSVSPGSGRPGKWDRQWVRDVASDPKMVAHWLKQIAQYLEKDRTDGGAAGVLLIYEIYRMVDQRLLRVAYAAFALVAAAVTGALIGLTAVSGSHPFPRIIAICVAAVFLAGAAYAAMFGSPTTPAGTSLRRQLETPRGLLDLVLSLVCALAASYFALGTDDTPFFRVIGGLCCGLMAGLFFGFVNAKRLRARGAGLQRSEGPSDPLRGGLENSSIVGGIIAAIYAAVLLKNGSGVTTSLIFAALTMTVFALTNGLPIASMAWSRYKLALLILFLQRRLPWRLVTFLEWNYEAGLMRTAGLAYQFRHLRMQSWLAETDEADLLPHGLEADEHGTPAVPQSER
jgi:hypothetical protein